MIPRTDRAFLCNQSHNTCEVNYYCLAINACLPIEVNVGSHCSRTFRRSEVQLVVSIITPFIYKEAVVISIALSKLQLYNFYFDFTNVKVMLSH